jgi:acyl-CoA dehydrogenase
MNFDFSDEQKAFGEQVRRMLDDIAPVAEARRVMEGEALYSAAAWTGLANLGFQAIMIGEEHGGLGLGALETCVAAEQIGRSMAPVPSLSSNYICAEAIRLHGSAEQQSRWLPGLADGSLIGTWALAEGREATSSVTTRFESGRLNGHKLPVLDGMAADIALVIANAPGDGAVLTVCSLSENTLDRRPVANVDPGRPVADIRFADTPAERLGTAGWTDWGTILNRAAVLLAFEQIGAADRALWMARDYALERKSFGRAIGSYQAIKHKLANIYAKNEIARSHAYYGAWALATGAPELPLAAAGARVSASEALSFAAQENVQTHGGIGFTWDSDCHLFYRRAQQYGLILGSTPSWRSRIFQQLQRQTAA